MKKEFSIVTFNLRCPWDEDGINSQVHRLGSVFDKIDTEQPDIVCFQEILPKSAEFFRRHMRQEYDIAFTARDDNDEFDGEGLMILYRLATVELQTLECFWLSPTPDVPGTRFPDQSRYARICQSAQFRRADTKEVFRVYNTHLDHIGPKARAEGMRVILDRIRRDREVFTCPLFLLGDMNDYPNSEPMICCREFQSPPLVDLTPNAGVTYHGYGTVGGEQIDFIFADAATAENPNRFEKWVDEADGIYLSDHYPLCLKIEL